MTVRYDYRGDIERGADYHWTPGYSATSPEGYVLYPWNTIPEIQRAEKARGNKALFFRDGRQVNVRKPLAQTPLDSGAPQAKP